LKYASSNTQETGQKPAFEHIPIKLCLAGKPFSGRKTQSKLLSENLPLKEYSFNDLAKKALDILEKLETPIEAHPKFKTFKKPQIDQMIAEKALEEQKYAEVKKQALIIRECRNNDRPVPDEIIINMLLEQINLDFPEKTTQEIAEEVLVKYRKKKEIEAELAKIKEEQIKKPKNKLKEEQNCLQELSKLTVDNRGFVLIDFPTSYNQIKLLEQTLTGYIPEMDRPVTELTLFKDSLAMLMDTTIKPKPKRELIKSAFDLIFNIGIDDQECIRRAVGRRIDPTNGNIYHIEDNPPPNDNKVLERLKPVEEEQTVRNYITKQAENYLNNYIMLKNFVEIFGDKENALGLYHEVVGKQPKDQLQNSIMEIINRLIAVNQAKEENIVNLQISKSENELSIQSQNKSQASNVNLKMVVNKKNVSPDTNVNNIDNPNQPAEGNVNLEKLNPVPLEKLNPVPLQIDVVEETELMKYEKKFEEIKKVLLPQQQVIEGILKNWFKLNEVYNRECKTVFKTIKKQKDSVISNFKRVQEKYYEFLIRPSKKQSLSLDFQLKYNKFLDNYSEMRDDQEQKDEFHLMIDELSDRIWDSIELR